MNIHYLTFSSKNFNKGCIDRQKTSLQQIQSEFNLFKTINVCTEVNLNKKYVDRFSKYYTDRGFASWSWKSSLLLDLFDKIDNNDYILYLDAGCVLDDHKKITDTVKSTCDLITSDEKYIALTNGGCANILIINKDIANDFELTEDTYFLNKYPHWQAGLILIRKCDNSVKLIQDWYDYFDKNYERCVHKDFFNKEYGINHRYIHNGSDQAILQALLYKGKIDVTKLNLNFTIKRKRT